MAKNTGKSHRKGSVSSRSQSFNRHSGNWVKRNADTGRFMNQKSGGKPFKGVAKEVDGRRS